MKKLVSILVVLLFIVGCSAPEEEESTSIVVVDTEGDSYDYVLPFEASSLRFKHTTGKDYLEIGQGLVDISKEYFPTNQYNLKEGSLLNSYSNDFHPLILTRESSDNPYGLNPTGETALKINADTEVTGPFLVADIYEVNFTSKSDNDDIKGISVALVLNKTIDDGNGNSVVVDDDVLYTFATEIAGRKLESYISKKESYNNVPIVMGIYVIDSSNDSIPGRYVAEAKFENGQGQFSNVNQQWAIFPTTEGRRIDGKIDEAIQNMKRQVNGFLPEDVGIVGYGEFKDTQLKQLKISVNVQTKTYTEVRALSYYIGELVKGIDTQAPIKVEIKSLNETLAIIVKPANKANVEVIMM